MERYIKPAIEIREIELTAIMAASPGASTKLDSTPNNVITDAAQLESKRTYSAWDDDEEE